jgi:iron(III) transport system substrate-binding protein
MTTYTSPWRRRSVRAAALLAALALTAAACGNDDEASPTTTGSPATTAAPTTAAPDEPSGPITLYSGRGEDLVGPVIEMFTKATGIEVEVRYGNSSEMLLLIQEEGNRSPADVYYSQGAGFMGIMSSEGRLRPLDNDVLDLVPASLRSPQGDWVGITGRARTLVYNTSKFTPADLPASIADLTDPKWKGRIAWAPTNASFQDHVTALRGALGEDATRAWLQGIMANQPVALEGNNQILQAVANGEADLGLTNHYYLYRFVKEDPNFPVANAFPAAGDPTALVNIAGAGVLATSDQPRAAQALLAYLLSPAAQTYFADTNYELPVIAGATPSAALPSIDSVNLPNFDLNLLVDVKATVQMLTDVGAL